VPEDNPPRRPTGASRARTGGTARRVDETTSRVPDDAPGAIPPSFSPGGGRGRPWVLCIDIDCPSKEKYKARKKAG